MIGNTVLRRASNPATVTGHFDAEQFVRDLDAGRYEADIPGAISQLSIEQLQQVVGVFVRLRKQRRVNLLKPTENSAPLVCSRLMDQEKMAAYHDAVQDFMAVVEELTPNNANWDGVYKRVQAAAKRCEELRGESEEAGGGSSDAGEVA
jgi:hypothetical protein